MIKLFTHKFKWALNSVIGLCALTLSMFSLQQATGQTYCAGTSYGCGITYGGYLAGDVTDITISNSGGQIGSWTGMSCSNSAATVINSGSPINITAGESLTITLKGTQNTTYNWVTHLGIWFDANRDGSFSAAECISVPVTGVFGSINTTAKTATVTVPCTGVNPGSTRMRFRGFMSGYGNNFTASNGCGAIGASGNTLDVEVNLQLGAPPVANFTVPTGPNYVKSNIEFNSTNTNSALVQTWNFGSGTPATGTGAKGKSKWSTAGTYPVELKQDYCGQKDSITKSVTIVNPTSVPVSDFISDLNEVEQYFNAQLYDLSSNGAYIWDWEVTDPTGFTTNYTDQNPIIFMDVLGKWDVCLTASNGLGAGNKLCKTKYIDCVPPTEFYLGPNHLGESKCGTLYDHNGPGANYGNNRSVTTDYFQILPCGAKKIDFSFDQITLNDANDKLRIYDGAFEDPNTEITPTGGLTGANYTQWKDSVFTAYSGSMYITFQTNNTGTAEGFTAKWCSELNPPVAPTVDFDFPYNPASVGVEVPFTANLTNASGAPTYDWTIDGNSVAASKDYTQPFYVDGTYQVCLDVTTCSGSGSKCKNITIITPSAPGALDFEADNVRPEVLENVQITTTTDYANKFKWSIFPLSYDYASGTNDSSQNPVISFKQGGSYTFTLTAWNATAGRSITEKKVIKNKYVVVVDPCTPLSNILSADIGISNVKLSSATKTMIDNASSAGVSSYEDYQDGKTATLNYGRDYTVEVSRPSNSNNANYNVWIDYNVDGDFDDAGEMVHSSGVISGLTTSGTFTVPARKDIFEGKTIMRVGSAYNNFSNTPCGVNAVGEFEDYRVILSNDGTIPHIDLIGGDTVYVEKATTANACWNEVAGTSYNVTDESTGDLNGVEVVTSDLDCTIPGIYTICINAEDASGNKAAEVCRTVYVVLDRTAPVITMNGTSPMLIDQCSSFTDPGAIANDATDGDLTTAIKTTGMVDANTVGDYTLVYSVQDAQGNQASVSRLVQVRDNEKPVILYKGSPITNGATVQVQIGGVFVDEVYTEDGCNGQIATTKTPGYAGPVNTSVKGIYPVIYKATDASNNVALEDGFVINYNVGDFIAPLLSLNTLDTILHDVNTPYQSIAPTYSDNIDPLSALNLSKTGSVDAYKLGTYSETFTVTDVNLNSTTKTRFVKVVDRIAPTITVTPVNNCIGHNFYGNSATGINIDDNYYTYSVLQPLVEIIDHNVNIWEAGVYYIKYRVTDPSGNTSNIAVRNVYNNYYPNCQNSLSATSLSLSDRVVLYPNPAENGKFNVSYSVANTENVQISVYDNAGRLIQTQTAEKGGMGKVEINLSNSAAGVYNVVISNAGNTAHKQVVLK